MSTRTGAPFVTDFSTKGMMLIWSRRYGDIIAYDRTRVLAADAPPAESESPPYVNASLVREPELGIDEAVLPRKWWIAAQVRVSQEGRVLRSAFKKLRG